MRSRFLLPTVLLALAPTAGADTVYVTDQFEITLRSGPSNNNRILRMLPTGTRLETLEAGPDGEYTRVRSGNGEGWVLSRYLIRQPVARERLRAATDQVRTLEAEREQLRAELAALQGRFRDTHADVARLEAANRQLEAELADIRESSAHVLELREESERLRSEFASASARIAGLEDETGRLRDRGRRDWFIAGAGVILLGLLLGLLLPRIRWRRRSSWGEL